MENPYDGLTQKEADDLMVGFIGLVVGDAMEEARAMTRHAWDGRDDGPLRYRFADEIYQKIQARRRGAP